MLIYTFINELYYYNQENLQTNLSTHNTNTRNKYHLDRSKAKLSCFQKSTFYAWHQTFQQFTM
jgi:hypothetical protein